MTLKAAGAEVGVTRERARQMVQELRGHAIRLPGKPVPNHDFRKLSELRAHSEFWLSRYDALERLWRLEDDGWSG
jgi:hypothetical protein